MTTTLEELETRNAVIENYNHYAQGLDTKDWDMVRACFADEVFIDYGDISAPTGAPDVARRSDDWMGVLQGVINGFDITRHTITNHRFAIADGEVSCTAYLLADHVIFQDPALPVAGAEDVVTVVGEYTNHYRLESGVGRSAGRSWIFTTAPATWRCSARPWSARRLSSPVSLAFFCYYLARCVSL